MRRNARSDGRGIARTSLVALVVLAFASVGAVAATAGPVAAQETGPTVTDVTTTRSNGTLTVSVTATNVTEIDVTGVPDSWSVTTHADNYGAYGDQLDAEDRVLWLWTVPVRANVSVTFAAAKGEPAPAPGLEVVPYDGTDRGQAVPVFPDATAATPTPTATGTEPGPTQTASSTDTPDPATPTRTPRTESGDSTTTGTTDGNGPGFGVTGAFAALVLVLAALVARRR